MIRVALIPNDFYVPGKEFEAVLDEVCVKENAKCIEIAYLWGKSILDLNEEEIAKLHETLDQRSIKIASIQTQIMKVLPEGTKLSSTGSKQMNRDQRFNVSRIDDAIRCAGEFGTKYIITYSYFTSTMGKKDHEKYWELMFQDYHNLVDKCQVAGKIMVVECEGDTLVNDAASYLRLFNHFNSPHLKANLDLSNFVSHAGQFTQEDFQQLKDHVEYFHVKDRIFRTGIFTKGILKKLFGGKGAVFGTGVIPWKQVLPWFIQNGFDGVLSVEPHVHGDDKFGKATQCVRNLQALLKELGIGYE
ncbi:MAG TPA: sugar phosphate isomerase/epimerase [Candidatus Lokiarchaeia archaeon]|nr:sugar phosphate isomerase/epimerase [Candidatus Lokiarchaeia archaeon]